MEQKLDEFHFYILLYSMKEKNIKIVKTFDFRFLMDLQVLRYPELDFNTDTKYLSVCF